MQVPYVGKCALRPQKHEKVRSPWPSFPEAEQEAAKKPKIRWMPSWIRDQIPPALNVPSLNPGTGIGFSSGIADVILSAMCIWVGPTHSFINDLTLSWSGSAEGMGLIPAGIKRHWVLGKSKYQTTRPHRSHIHCHLILSIIMVLEMNFIYPLQSKIKVVSDPKCSSLFFSLTKPPQCIIINERKTAI